MILLNAFIAGLFVYGDAGVGVAGVAGFSGEVTGLTEVTGFTGFVQDSSNSCSVSFLGHCSLSRILIGDANQNRSQFCVCRRQKGNRIFKLAFTHNDCATSFSSVHVYHYQVLYQGYKIEPQSNKTTD